MKCVFTFPVAGPRTPSLTLTRKKATPRRGSLKPSTPRVLTQFFYVINLVITSIILVILSNLVNSVKLIMSQSDNKLLLTNPWLFLIKMFCRGESRENSVSNPPGCIYEVIISQALSEDSKPPGSHYTQLPPQLHTRLHAAERTTHHGFSSIKCNLYLYHVIFLLLVSPKTRTYYHVSNRNHNVT